jgi:hypothetical protein
MQEAFRTVFSNRLGLKVCKISLNASFDYLMIYLNKPK